MSFFYLDTEIAFTKKETVLKLEKGEYAPFDLHNFKIITIQYQELEKGGKLHILKEWESSEEEIIKRFAKIFNPDTAWQFAPVGYNVYFDIGVFLHRAEHFGIKFDRWKMYHDFPAVDIRPICICMNGMNFKNSGLDKFTGKGMNGSQVPVWYEKKEYSKIIDYVEKETKEFTDFYYKLKEKMPKFREEQGFFGKENNHQ